MRVNLTFRFQQTTPGISLDKFVVTATDEAGRKLGSIGGTVFTPVDDDDAYPEVRVPYLMLTDFAVEESARGKGIGKMLAEAAIRRGAQRARASISDDILSGSGLVTIRSVVSKYPSAEWVETRGDGYNAYRFRLTPWRGGRR